MVQLQFLNRIIQSGDMSLVTINNLTDEYFSEYKKEFHYIKDHFDTYGNVPDKETFLAEFKDFDYIEVKETSDYLIDELYNDKNTRDLANVFNKVRTQLLNKDVDAALKTFSAASQNIGQAIHMDSVDIFKDTSRYEDYVDRCNNFNSHYVSTGFKEIDNIIGGWDREEEYATITARTNNGKSWLLLKTAITAAEAGLNVGIYSGEMTVKKVGYRIDTLISHISNSCMTHGNSSIQVEYKRYIEGLQKGKIKGSIKILTPDKINGGVGVTALKGFIEKDKLDMLCIDQFSLLDDDARNSNPVSAAANISKSIKQLQTKVHIPIIMVAQLNRGDTEESGITTKNIGLTDRIGQDSTVVIAFEKKDELLNVSLMKSRDSGAGMKLQYAVNFDKGTFEYLPAKDDANGGEGSEDLHNEYDTSGGQMF